MSRKLDGPVLFADVDGVLNHPGIFSEVQRRHERERETRADRTLGNELALPMAPADEAEYLDGEMVARLSRVLVESNALLAISSSWRNRHDAAAMRDMLRRRGLDPRVSVAVCPAWCSESDGITRFLRLHGPVGRYAVVSDSTIDPPHDASWVRTSGAVGLTEELAGDLLRLLLPCAHAADLARAPTGV